MAAAPLRVLDQGVAHDAHRIVGLRLLDRRVLGVLEVGLDRVHAVGGEGGPVAARDRLVVREVLAAARAHAPERDVAHAALGARHHPVGQRGGERLEQQIAELHRDLPARGHRGGMLGVHHRAGSAPDVDEPVEAVVHRDVGVDQALEHVHHPGVGLRRGGVGGRLALVVAVGEIDGQPALLDRHGGREPDRLVGDPVAVHEHVRREAAVRELGEGGPRPALGVAQELVEVVAQRGRAVLRDDRLDPLRAQPVGRGLGAEVAGDLARAAEVGADHREQVAVDLAALHEAHRGNDQPLLVDLARHPDAPGGAAAHVDVVGDVRHVAEERLLVEHGGDERDVVEMDPPQIGVVDQDPVAGGEALGPVGRDRPRHDVGERAQVRRLGEGLGDGPQVAVEERAGEVAPRLDVGRVRRAPERRPHLLGDREERVADDLEADRIDVGRQRAERDGRSRHGPVWYRYPPIGDGTISRVIRQGG